MFYVVYDDQLDHDHRLFRTLFLNYLAVCGKRLFKQKNYYLTSIFMIKIIDYNLLVLDVGNKTPV